MKKVTFAALAALTITACSSGPKFQVNGDVSGADGKMLYLEASGLEGIVPLDSVKLKGEGTFSFKQPRPESPEFYRLRIDDKNNSDQSAVCGFLHYLHGGRFGKQQQDKRADAEADPPAKRGGRLAGSFTQ